MPPNSNVESEAKITTLFSHIHYLLLQSWNETGYGQIIIDSQRGRRGKIQVIIRGSTHYSCTITDEDVQQMMQEFEKLRCCLNGNTPPVK